jgi:aryl-alcohol dehydrogenase-like predicted oxidoreductase
MEKRPLGHTGHHSTVAILGAFAFSEATREETDRAMELVLEAGINHIDVAPTYGHAEEMLGPWLARERERFFLGCKTMERGKAGAARELRESLEKLQVDQLDLYQIHAVTTDEELDQALAPGGALEAMIEARDEGLTRFLGITGHGEEIPRIMLRALDEFAFDTVLFPINYIQYTNPTYKLQAEKLVKRCKERGVGTLIIKPIARGEWGDQPQRYNTWYEPFDSMDHIQAGINFALSQDVTGICTTGDLSLLPKVLEACQNYRKLSEGEQQALIVEGKDYRPLFPLQED